MLFWGPIIIVCEMIIFGETACPKIVSREEWGGRPPVEAPEDMATPVLYIVIHHGGSKGYCDSQEECISIVRSYQNYHMDSHKWNDIGYNFVVGEDGNTYEGRGWSHVGAHAPTFNNRSIGICVVGDFTGRVPNKAALDDLEQIIECGVELGYVRKDYLLIGHRQNPSSKTVCPGDAFYKEISAWPHWTNISQHNPASVKQETLENSSSGCCQNNYLALHIVMTLLLYTCMYR